MLALLNYADTPVQGLTVTLTSPTAPGVKAWHAARAEACPLSAVPHGPSRWLVQLPPLAVECFLQLGT